MSTITIAAMRDVHADQVLEIYRLGIATGNATFEIEPPDWARFTATRLPVHRFVTHDADGTVLGWIA